MEEEITRKNGQLRNNEYYRMQFEFDYLYKESLKEKNFTHLMERILKEDNIRLAYRNIKTNKGSSTSGLSGKDLSFISKMNLRSYLRNLKKSILDYKPKMIRRVGIPKSNGKTRYLGIKEPEDKIIEQCIYQILDPIVTARFHKNSNGFIKGRNCKRAIAQTVSYINTEKLYFVVDIDIKGFFDNVDHGKLLKQLWSIGIRDKELLSILSKMLKAEVFKEGIPNKGTPQGGILSPLLANIVLNELDWWLESKKEKGIRFVRYADDFKIFCPTFSVAREMLVKTTKWLKQRLKLEVSEEKTKIVNLKRNYSEFLGTKLKVKKKKNKWIVTSHMSDKALKNAKEKIKKQIRVVKRYKMNPKKCEKELNHYNSLVMGLHNYYEVTTCISQDLDFIGYIVFTYVFKNFKEVLQMNLEFQSKALERKYGLKENIPFIRGTPILPIEFIKHNPRMYKGEKINYYDSESRKKFHKELEISNEYLIDSLLRNPKLEESVEFNDNVLSKFCGQYGKCGITGEEFLDIKEIEMTHRKEYSFSDKYDNILLVNKKIVRLLKEEIFDDWVEKERMIIGLKKEHLMRINKIRKENNLPAISL